jgi:succinyl-CoA synthetase alpha subunit
MSVIVNEVHRATYFDSIVLMRLSRQIASLAGVEEASLILGTQANKALLREAGILGPGGDAAEDGDLILALRASDEAAAEAALAEAKRLLDHPIAAGVPASLGASRTIRGAVTTRTVRTAVTAMPAANLALISVPGHFAAAEARKALALGLHVMIFSDNVPIAEEVALKREARDRGLMVMGPDCGTAIVGGAPLAFANAVPRGDIGIVGASGTGIQEVSCLIARAGAGISHAIGTGGRDLDANVGAITTLMAIDALDADAGTRHIVLISKPPAAAVSKLVLDRVARSRKPFTVCFLGAKNLPLPANAHDAATLKAAAELCLGRSVATGQAKPQKLPADRGKLVRGLFAGGTFCAEAQIVFRQAGLKVASNVAVPGAASLAGAGAHANGGHVMIDLGADEFTRGRPHPMIEPAVRDGPLNAALADPAVGVVLIDLVLGYGAHSDPAGHLAGVLAGRGGAGRGGPLVVASVTGTDGDPQPRSAQVRTLVEAGVIVAESNADAAAIAIQAIGETQ